MPTVEVSVDELWDSTPRATRYFDPAQLAPLPTAARSYLQHAIAPSVSLASAVRLHMHGKIKLKQWRPFTAEEVIRWDVGFIWQASIRFGFLPISGSDSWLHGAGALHWRVLGLLPFLSASSPGITRSAAGRLNAEVLWLPSALLLQPVSWTQSDPLHPRACFLAHSESTALDLALDPDGRLLAFHTLRWSNPNDGAFRLLPFGGFAEAESTFAGYTIPTRLSAGWHFGEPRFAAEGEFFRATIDHAEFR